MITMTTNLATVHGTRLWTELVVVQPYARVPKPRPSVSALAGVDFDNSTDMSAVRCRHR